MKRVSVIIPSYGSNTDPCRAVDSVFAQSYAEVEVIVVDDNGRNTEQQKLNECTFKKYAKEARFKYIVHEKNQGGSVARNTGAAAASGDYLCFLDDDDFFSDRDKIKKQIEADCKLDESWAGTYSSLHKYLGDKPIREIIAKYSGNIVVEFIEGKTSIGTAAPIIRKKCFEAIGGFDGSFKRHQDWEFFSRLADKYQLMAVPEAYYDRCYKVDVPKKDIETRISYMDKYVDKMKAEITSIPKKRLNKLMKRKYVSIVFALIKNGQWKRAKEVGQSNGFGISEYMYMAGSVVSYAFHRVAYGSHF